MIYVIRRDVLLHCSTGMLLVNNNRRSQSKTTMDKHCGLRHSLKCHY